MREPAPWWPEDLGLPTAVGGQDDLRYAYFAGRRRLTLGFSQTSGFTRGCALGKSCREPRGGCQSEPDCQTRRAADAHR